MKDNTDADGLASLILEDNGPRRFIAGSRIPESDHFQIRKRSPLRWNPSFYQSIPVPSLLRPFSYIIIKI